LKTIEENLQKS